MAGAPPATHIATRDVCISSLLEAMAERAPTSIAIAAPGRTPLAYGRLRLLVHEVRDALNKMGVGRGDRVAVALPGGPEMAAAFVAVAAAATCAPLNPARRAGEFDWYLSDLRPKAVIARSGTDSAVMAVARARGIPVITLMPRSTGEAGMFALAGDTHQESANGGFSQSGDTALVLYTSGTTARPKKIQLTHANICTSARSITATLDLTNRDRCLNVMPLYHVHGLIGATLSTLAAGASIVCPPAFDPIAFYAWLEEFLPSWYTAVPTIHQAILSHASEYTDIIRRYPLRFVRSCSSPLPPRMMEELERVFNAPVIEAYGMTEASHQISSNPLPPRIRKVGSVGTATRCEVAIMDGAGDRLPPGTIGEIVIRGPSVGQCDESHLRADPTALVNGWFRTGDQGFLDADGYLFIKDRLKDILNRGGTKISPREIEEALRDYPGIAQVIVFGVPHNTLGEDIAAAVVFRKNATATEDDIRQFAATRLSDFQVPSRVLIVDEIPQGGTGKFQRSHMADRLAPLLNPPFVSSSTPLEWELTQIWANVLGVARVGLDDNFFELGGTSLSAIHMLAEVQKITGRSLPMATLLRAPTVKQFIDLLRQEGASGPWPSLVAIQAQGSRPPFFCVHAGGGHVLHLRHLARHLGSDQPFFALQQQGLDGVHSFHTRIEDMATHYVQEIRACVSQGPYFIGGYSFGALVAYEMARQLWAQGQTVALLALIDGWFPNLSQSPTSPDPPIGLLLRRIRFHVDNFIELGPRSVPRYVADRLNLRISRIAARWFPALFKPLLPTALPSMGAHVLPPALREIQRINGHVELAYVPTSCPGRATVFLARRWNVFDRRDHRVPVGLAAGGLEIHKIPGDHLSIVEEPRVRILAQKLRNCLDKAIKSLPGEANRTPVALGFSPLDTSRATFATDLAVGRAKRASGVGETP